MSVDCTRPGIPILFIGRVDRQRGGANCSSILVFGEEAMIVYQGPQALMS